MINQEKKHLDELVILMERNTLLWREKEEIWVKRIIILKIRWFFLGRKR